MTALRTPLLALGALALLAGCDATVAETSASAFRVSAVSEAKIYQTDRHKVYQFETDGDADLQFDINLPDVRPEEFEIASVYDTPSRQNEDYIRFYQRWSPELQQYTLSFKQDGTILRPATVQLFRGPTWKERGPVVASGRFDIPDGRGNSTGRLFASLSEAGKSYHTNRQGDTIIDYEPDDDGNTPLYVTLWTETHPDGTPRPVVHSGITYIAVSPEQVVGVPPNQIRIHVDLDASITFYPLGQRTSIL